MRAKVIGVTTKSNSCVKKHSCRPLQGEVEKCESSRRVKTRGSGFSVLGVISSSGAYRFEGDN